MIFAKQALLHDRWAVNVRVEVREGVIARVTTDTVPQSDDCRVSGLLPALANVHSHTFQRAMAGMTEHRVAGRESFWTWRDIMYRFLGQLTPDTVEAIAALAFMEMQEAGYSAVGEFHYLHHRPDGEIYDDIAEVSARIFAAASLTGIGLTHLPVLYTYGGAGKLPLLSGQVRFGNSVDRFATLLEAVRKAVVVLPADTRVGIAPHSLRAIGPDDLQKVLPLADGNPIHIHIAEQPKEVADVVAWLGARPVEWLLSNAPVDADWCPIHATHMTTEETVALAATGAVAGLCPITEANLGDGTFNGPAWLTAGGAFGIGSDSNVRISVAEELRTLEYGQRLRDLARNVMVEPEGSVGSYMYVCAASGGAKALGRKAGAIAVGNLADLVAIDLSHPSLCGLNTRQILDGWIFSAPDTVVTDLWSAGRHQVRHGRHIHREEIVGRWQSALGRLLV